MDRFVLGRMQNPVRGILHGSAAIVSVGGLVALVTRTNGAGMTSAGVVYGLALIAMYLTSALYHSVPWQERWKLRLQRLDHTFIYALVAATFTALAVGVGIGGWLVSGLVGIWTLAVLGAAKEVREELRRILLPFQFLAVAAVLPALWLTLTGTEFAAAALTVVGGACYIVGAVLFVNDIPRLAPRVFSHHEVFHVVVILASVLHFIAVWRVIAPA